MRAARGGRFMRHTPDVAEQSSVLRHGQRQRNRKDADSKHGFNSLTLVARNGPGAVHSRALQIPRCRAKGPCWRGILGGTAEKSAAILARVSLAPTLQICSISLSRCLPLRRVHFLTSRIPDRGWHLEQVEARRHNRCLSWRHVQNALADRLDVVSTVWTLGCADGRQYMGHRVVQLSALRP
jgi:hypothetical protein